MEKPSIKSKTYIHGRYKNKHILNALGLGLLVFVFISLVGSLFALIPPPITIGRIITVISISFILAIGRVWNKLKPESWPAQLIVFFGLTSLLLAWAIHCLSFGIIGIDIWIWLIPLISAFLLAWILPIIDPTLAKVIDNEQFAPKTTFGRGCLAVALSIGGAAGALGASIGRFLNHDYGHQIVLLVLGTGVSIITIALSQTFAYQIHTKRLHTMSVKQNSQQEEEE